MTLLADARNFFGTEALQDPYPLYDRMRDQAPVHRIGDSGFYAVCGWDAVAEAVNRVEDFSSNLTATMVYHDDGTVTPFDMGTLGDPMHALATADDPLHDAHRKLLLPHLSARRIRVIEEFAEATASQLWAEGLVDGRIEWMSAMANRLPMMVVTQLLGLPDDDVDKLIRRAYATLALLDAIRVRHGALREGRGTPCAGTHRRPRRPLRFRRIGAVSGAFDHADVVQRSGRIHSLLAGQRRVDSGKS
jgi:cytochrome P450